MKRIAELYRIGSERPSSRSSPGWKAGAISAVDPGYADLADAASGPRGRKVAARRSIAKSKYLCVSFSITSNHMNIRGRDQRDQREQMLG